MEMKLDALKRIDKGKSVIKVANDLNVGRSTVIVWNKTRNVIESWCMKRLCSESIDKRKSMKRVEYEKVSEAFSSGLAFSGKKERRSWTHSTRESLEMLSRF